MARGSRPRPCSRPPTRQNDSDMTSSRSSAAVSSGRMLALAGLPLGPRVPFLDQPRTPPGLVGELVVGDYDDEQSLRGSPSARDVVTFEFENVRRPRPRRHARCPPPKRSSRAGPPRREASSSATSVSPRSPSSAASSQAREIGLPAVLKTRRFGYDGKGQRVLRRPGAPPVSGPGRVPYPRGFVPFDARAVDHRGARRRRRDRLSTRWSRTRTARASCA